MHWSVVLVCFSAMSTCVYAADATVSVERGLQVSITHDCHTADYAESGGKIDPSAALRGSPIGWRGPLKPDRQCPGSMSTLWTKTIFAPFSGTSSPSGNPERRRRKQSVQTRSLRRPTTCYSQRRPKLDQLDVAIPASQPSNRLSNHRGLCVCHAPTSIRCPPDPWRKPA